MSILLAASAEGDGFVSPGPKDFEFPGIFSPDSWFTKPILIVIVAALLVGVLFYLAARRASVVPTKGQFAGESLYGFVRNDIALDAIGHRDGMRFVPYLATLFSFIAVMNIAGIIPLVQFPASSRIAFPLVLAVIAWVIYLYLGINKHGFVKYFKDMMFPAGIPWPVYILLAPIEFFSTVIVRPLTLTLRLTFNMFAGHLVLLLFVLGGEYLLVDYGGAVGIVAGSVSIFGSIVLTFFEGFVQLLQA
ncbi:MAG: F-type H+-transporting ATPase subunit a, partial [Frankiales bacterium]|nr:F-type H+-transporting ATPase subunit a [Frankiales bacterium]